MKGRVLSVLLTALVGVLAGTYLPGAARAENYHMWFGPPTREANGDTSMLTQGWHGTYYWGYWALDWGYEGHLFAYTRIWAESSDSEPTVRAYATPYDEGGWDGCDDVVWVDIWDEATEIWQASQGHVHAYDPQFERFNIEFAQNGSSAEEPAKWLVARLLTEDTSCSWEGPHDHETSVPGYGWMDRNTSVYDHEKDGDPNQYYGNCPDTPGDCPQMQNNDFDNWQRAFWW